MGWLTRFVMAFCESSDPCLTMRPFSLMLSRARRQVVADIAWAIH